MPTFLVPSRGSLVMTAGSVMKGAASPGQHVWMGRRPRSTSSPSRTISCAGPERTLFGSESAIDFSLARPLTFSTRPCGGCISSTSSSLRATASSDVAPKARHIRRSVPNWLIRSGWSDPLTFSNKSAGPLPLTTRSVISVISRCGSTSARTRRNSSSRSSIAIQARRSLGGAKARSVYGRRCFLDLSRRRILPPSARRLDGLGRDCCEPGEVPIALGGAELDSAEFRVPFGGSPQVGGGVRLSIRGRHGGEPSNAVRDWIGGVQLPCDGKCVQVPGLVLVHPRLFQRQIPQTVADCRLPRPALLLLTRREGLFERLARGRKVAAIAFELSNAVQDEPRGPFGTKRTRDFERVAEHALGVLELTEVLQCRAELRRCVCEPVAVSDLAKDLNGTLVCFGAAFEVPMQCMAECERREQAASERGRFDTASLEGPVSPQEHLGRLGSEPRRHQGDSQRRVRIRSRHGPFDESAPVVEVLTLGFILVREHEARKEAHLLVDLVSLSQSLEREL